VKVKCSYPGCRVVIEDPDPPVSDDWQCSLHQGDASVAVSAADELRQRLRTEAWYISYYGTYPADVEETERLLQQALADERNAALEEVAGMAHKQAQGLSRNPRMALLGHARAVRKLKGSPDPATLCSDCGKAKALDDGMCGQCRYDATGGFG
jgi:hypothetical protein